MGNTLQLKRGNKADLPTLAAGEPGWCADTFELFIGTGAGNKQVITADFFDATSFLYATDANTPLNKTPAQVMAILSGTAAGDFAMNTHKITGVTDPTGAQDAATKAYVDAVAQGLKVKTAVACASTGTLTLSAEQTIDGVLTSTSRVLVKNQTDPKENGIYVSAAGAWSRATDFDAAAEVPGSFVLVSGGSTLLNTKWVCTNEPEAATPGTDNITWSQFSDASSGATTFLGLTDTPANYTDAGLKIVRVNTGASALEFVGFAATYLDDTAGGTNGEVAKGATSNVVYDHGVATTGVHGAGGSTLLHSGSTIDCGTFA